MSREFILVASRFALLAAAGLLSACQYFGPKSIDVGRADYNSAIQHTSAQQVLANIIRVHDYEMPLVMDVTQVNASLIVQGTGTSAISGIGGLSGIAGAGPVVATSPTAGSTTTKVVSSQVASIGGTFEYEENPTITYTPLTGQPLIAQLATPITVDSLAALPDHGWSLPSLMSLAVSYLTPNFADKYFALNAILELDSYGAIATAAARSKLSGTASIGFVGAPPPPGTTTGLTPQSQNNGPNTGQAANDSLMIYLQPKRAEADGIGKEENILKLWIRLLKIYWGTQSSSESQSYDIKLSELDKIIDALNDFDNRKPLTEEDQVSLDNYLDEKFRSLPNWLQLRTTPVEPSENGACNYPLNNPSQFPGSVTCESLAPVLRTNSALGVLKNATARPVPEIEFLTPDMYRKIRHEDWNTSESWESVPDFYTILPEDEDSAECDNRREPRKSTTGDILKDGAGNTIYEYGGCDSPTDADNETFNRLTNFISCYISNAEIPIYTVTVNKDVNKKCDVKDYHSDSSRPTSENWFGSPANPTAYRTEERLGDARRYVLIIESTKPPEEALPDEDAYVSFQSRGRWYFISENDDVSKVNFALISELVSIMAIPTQTGQPSATVSVNGH